ncbi:uncharacterized protein DUF3175 [Rhizobium azibense]|nr:uncharacterized protein DUF3175 [Rhizobium azibense]
MVASGDRAQRRHGPQGSVFKSDDPRKIAASIKHSTEASRRRKSGPFRSAMSMLSFYIYRAGDQLTKKKKNTLEQAKEELRNDFGRETKR